LQFRGEVRLLVHEEPEKCPGIAKLKHVIPFEIQKFAASVQYRKPRPIQDEAREVLESGFESGLKFPYIGSPKRFDLLIVDRPAGVAIMDIGGLYPVAAVFGAFLIRKLDVIDKYVAARSASPFKGKRFSCCLDFPNLKKRLAA
jgi:hypothetical protein